MNEKIIQQLTHLLEPMLVEKNWFLVEMSLSAGNQLRIFIDCDEGIKISDCTAVSRFLNAKIEEEKLFVNYSLEVSSPGLERPLTLARQYRKNIGRELQILTVEGANHEGKLKEADDNKIILEEMKREGGKGKPKPVETEIGYLHIRRATIKLKF